MYSCESCAIKKTECQTIDAFFFPIVVLKKTLENPLHCMEFKPINPKINQPQNWSQMQTAEKDPGAGKD